MKFPRARWFLLIAASLIAATTVHAEFIGWHPQLQGIRVGRGIDLLKQEETKGFVANFDTTPIPGGAGTKWDQNVRFVQDTFDMAQAFSMNVSLSVRSKVYSGSVGYSQAEAAVSSGNRITFVMDCARVLPDELFAPTGLTPQFRSAVAELKRSYSGKEFERQLGQTYGTHYVSGVRRAFKAALVFTFSFDSHASARSQSLTLSAKYRGGIARGDFDGDVSSFFARRDSRFSLNYEFRSLNPFSAPPPFATNAAITSFSQFQNLANQFEVYCQTVDLAQAVPIGYTIEPFRNLAAYQDLVGVGGISDIQVADYSPFMQTFSDLSGWLETLNLWTSEPERMNWLNSKGKNLVTAMRGHVDSQLQTMREAAKAHFETGAKLDVPADIINYRANLAQIPVPRIVVLGRTIRDGGGLWFGYINAGPLELTVQSPFQSVFLTRRGLEEGNEPPIYWSGQQFLDYVRALPFGPQDSEWRNSIINGPRWNAVVEATKRARIGFFYGGTGSFSGSAEEAAITMWNLKDAGVPPRLVDSLPVLESRTDELDMAGAEAFSGDVRLLGETQSFVGPVGRSLPAVLTVTNAGPGAVFGTTVTVPIPDGVDIASASSSQGSASQAGRSVTFRVGALAAGSSATLKLGLIPLTVGRTPGATGLSVSLAPEAADPDASNNTARLPEILGSAPSLKASPGSGTVRLSWTADTDRLGIEEATTLTGGGNWQPSSGVVSADGSQRTAEVPANGSMKLYRLTVR